MSKRLLTLFLTLALFIIPSVLPASATTVPLPGDVDNDGVIDSADISLLRRYISANDKNTFLSENPDFNEDNADVNGDGEINAEDVALLRRYVAGFRAYLGSTLSEDAIVFSIRPADGTPEVLAAGENFTMEIYLDNPAGKSIGSICFLGVKFDESVLQWNLTGEYNPDIPNSQPFRAGDVPSENRLRLLVPNRIYEEAAENTFGDFNAMFSFDSQWDYTGTGGVLITLDFKAKINTPVPDITLSVANVYCFYDRVLDFGTEYGFLPGTTFVRNAIYETFTPFSTPLYGDVNGSGGIDSADVTVLRRYIANGRNTAGITNFNLANADVNGDRFIDINDVNLLRRYLGADGRGVPLGPIAYNATVNTYFDGGYPQRFRETPAQSAARMNANFDAVADIYWNYFGLNLIRNNATQITSLIDTCKATHTVGAGIDDPCSRPNHDDRCTNRNNLRDDFIARFPGSPTHTTALWSGHRIISVDPFNGNWNTNRSLSYGHSIFMLYDFADGDTGIRRVLLHEMNHQFGARDHYHSDLIDHRGIRVCARPDICSRRECNAPNARDIDCIMGSPRERFDIICEPCRYEILGHLSRNYN